MGQLRRVKPHWVTGMSAGREESEVSNSSGMGHCFGLVV